MQRYNIFRAPPNSRLRFDGFLPSKLLKFGRIDASIILLSSNRNIGAILMKNSSNLLTLGRAHASIALLSLNRNFEHELTAFAVEPAHARQSRCEHHSALA